MRILLFTLYIICSILIGFFYSSLFFVHLVPMRWMRRLVVVAISAVVGPLFIIAIQKAK
jgi:hypothetical protein